MLIVPQILPLSALGGLGGLSPTLDMRFANDKFLDSRITYTGASVRSMFDNSGTLVFAPHNLTAYSAHIEVNGPGKWGDFGFEVMTPTGHQVGVKGDTSACKLTGSGATFTNYKQDMPTLPGFTYTFSFWAKTLSGTAVISATHTDSATGDFSDAEWTFTTTWTKYEISVLGNAGGNGLVAFGWQDRVSGGTAVFIIDRPMLERASARRVYNATTGATLFYAPRFTHLPISPFTSLGFLVEETRTNLILQSEDFDTTWVNSWGGGTLITVNAAVAPDGNTTADLLRRENADFDGNQSPEITVATSSVYTFSIYAKNLDSHVTEFNWDSDLAQNPTPRYTWTAGVPAVTQTTGTISTTIEDVGDGWYRLMFSFTSDGTDVNGLIILFPEAAGSGTEGVYFWGAQLELGVSASSYIPTTTASVARAADVPTMSDVSWLNILEGTNYVEFREAQNAGGTVFSLTDAANERYEMDTESTATQCRIIMLSNGNLWGNNVVGNKNAVNVLNKLAFAYKLDEKYRAALNGDLEDAAGTEMDDAWVLTTAAIGFRDRFDNRFLNGTISRITFWPVRRPNADLVSLTL